MCNPRASALLKRGAIVISFILSAAADCCAQLGAVEPEPKPVEWHMIFAMSFRGGYSEIGPIAPVSHRYVSNIDFSIFDTTFTIETEQVAHNYMIFGCPIGVQELTLLQRDWPFPLPLLGGPAQYKPLLASGNAIGSDPEVAALDLLHRYYDLFRLQLTASAAERERLQDVAAAEEEVRKANTPPQVGPPVRVLRIEPAKHSQSPR